MINIRKNSGELTIGEFFVRLVGFATEILSNFRAKDSFVGTPISLAIGNPHSLRVSADHQESG